MVFSQVGVLIGGFTSNTTVAVLAICVLLANPLFDITLKSTLPWPSGEVLFGGRNPRVASCGVWPVAGSSELKRQVTSPVAKSRPALILTISGVAGRRSTSALNWVRSLGGIMVLEPNEIGPNL